MNYASMLPCMDKLFGTWYLPKKQWPAKYGIDAPLPPDLAGQLLYPFMPIGVLETDRKEDGAENQPVGASG